VQKKQLQVLGQNYGSFDVYNHRGAKLRAALEQKLEEGSYSSILYSNPNNPSWICFTDEELQIIGEIANRYDLIVIEDLAYFAMDFRHNYGVPGEAPYQPTVAKYTDNYVFLISSSKAFSYAGQRIGSLVISDKLFNREFADLEPWYKSRQYGYATVFGALYALSSGVSHSAQYGLAAMLKAANEGRFDFVSDVRVYGERAQRMKRLFIDHGFSIVYDRDDGEPLADGFYFTFAYPGMSGKELVEKLIYFGISAIALETTGSERTEGLRACVSQVDESQFADLQSRLKLFNARHHESTCPTSSAT
jgi:aspartate/methionine/tyrosine aminotransferase